VGFYNRIEVGRIGVGKVPVWRFTHEYLYWIVLFLGALTKFRKATGWLRHACLSVCPPAWNSGSHWTDFHEIWYLSIFFFLEKSVEKIQV